MNALERERLVLSCRLAAQEEALAGMDSDDLSKTIRSARTGNGGLIDQTIMAFERFNLEPSRPNWSAVRQRKISLTMTALEACQAFEPESQVRAASDSIPSPQELSRAIVAATQENTSNLRRRIEAIDIELAMEGASRDETPLMLGERNETPPLILG